MSFQSSLPKANCSIVRPILPPPNNLPSVTDDILPSHLTTSLAEQCGDGTSLCILRCKNKTCKLSSLFFPRDLVFRSTTHRLYDCIVPPGTTYVDCMSSNVVYRLTCDNCSLQYVGETVQTLNQRYTAHRNGFSNPEKYGVCRILTEHFTSGPCKNSTYKVQILEKIPGNGRTARNAIDATSKKLRRERELHWMLKLRTVYPYGLNDRVGDEFKVEKNQKLIGQQFPKLSRNFNRRSRGNSNNSTHLDVETFLNNVDNLLKTYLPECMNYIRITISSLPKNIVKEIRELINDTILIQEDLEFSQWYLAAIDAIESKLYTVPSKKSKKSAPLHTLKLEFVNKAMEIINIPNILHSPTLSTSFPKLSNINSTYEVPTVVFKLVDAVHTKIFNHNKFVKSLDLNTFAQDETIIPCNCTNSPFADSHHNHIITGDLSFVDNKKLRKLFSRGPNYREPKNPDFKEAEDEIRARINELITTWSKKFCQDKIVFNEWKVEFEKLLSARIAHLKNTFKIRKVVPILEQIRPKQALKQLHKNYVITPIDKATGNVAFICKRFYAKILLEELDLNTSNKDKTYIEITEFSKETIINKHKSELKDLFGIDIEESNLVLPGMHWLPKKHKNPSKARFIVAASLCTLKPLARSLTSVFKLFQKQVENYNLKGQFFSGVKPFWIIQDKQPVIKAIKNLNKRRCAKSITTFDFSTLYTKIPHIKLNDVLHELTDFCFKGTANCKIRVNKFGAYWSKGNGRNINKDLSFTKDQIKSAISYLLDNCYFCVGNSIFKQIIGIPMGSDPAPFMANLFLYHYESKFLLNLKKIDLPRARRFGNVFRYIDDLNAINDGGEFENCHKEIYPPELELKKENEGNSAASFLDLDISISNDRTFDIKLYDKRDAFPFKIVRMPYLSSNMPSRIFYASLGGELLRIARCTTNISEFSKSSQCLLNRVNKQGAKISRVKKTIIKIFNNHPSDFEPFFKSASELSHKILLY